jgi:hypothetical protein
MSTRSLVSFVFACAAAALVLVTADSSHAITKCKVKVDKKTGLIRVDATGVSGPLQWGGKSGGATNSFFNDATCVASGRAKSCTLADPATIDSKTPPAGCTIHLDDGGTPCSAWIKGCTPARVLCASQVGDDVFFEGCNVHVRSGSGATDGDTGAGVSVNGLGNLIVGYDESNGINDKSGSHNLVVGERHSYKSYAGFVAGENNEVSGDYSSVSGGYGNTASGNGSSVSSGLRNTASGPWSSVTGGKDNSASGNYSSVSGGDFNSASGNYSSVSGGYFNSASDTWSWVSGGYLNSGSGLYSSVSGGSENTASGNYSSVSGGYFNTASGHWSSVTGGKINTASGHVSSVSGGNSRAAPDQWDWVAGSLFETE